MRVTDAQVHIWEDPRSGFPWEPLYNLERLERDMSLADVNRVVLVPTRHGFEDDLLGVNEYNFAAARAQPNRFAVMALIDPERPDGPAALADMLKRPGVKGLRINFAHGAPESADWIWPQMVRLGMPVAIFAARGDFPKVQPIVERYPELSVLLSHAGVPAPGPEPFAHLDKVLALAKYPNVVVQTSAFTRYSNQPYPFRDLHQHIRRLFDTFGPQRLAWGSDYSTHANRTSYREVVDLFRVVCDFFSPSDLEWIMDRTLSRVLKWEV